MCVYMYITHVLLLILFIANPFDLMKQDQHWLPGLDGSRWLYYVRYMYVLVSVC